MKSLPYFVVGLLIISSFAAVGIGKEASIFQEKTIKEKPLLSDFSNLKITTTKINDINYAELSLDGSEGYLYQAGEPILPISRTLLTLPFATKIIEIKCETSEIKTKQLSNKIIPAPNLVIQGLEDQEEVYEMDSTIYESSELYPSNWYEIFTGAGLDDNNEHKTFINIRYQPVRYSPATDTLYYTDSIKLKIKYEEPSTNPFPETSTYDLVIIAPQTFKSDLNALVTHKNRFEIKTTIKTTEDIYKEYSGVDKPEKIKYFIKDAIETWGVTYVMLVGGMKSLIFGQARDDQNQGTKDWHVPVRYTNLRDQGSVYDPGTISDLYYADIYNSTGGFSSWDTNEDGIFARWSMFVGKNDILDLYPDVYIGRLACRNRQEVKAVVTKIVDYERHKHRSNWFDNMMVIGGDSHDDSSTNFLEGEVSCDFVLERYMTEFAPIKIYASNKDTSNPVPKAVDIIGELNSEGCGHMLFEGHGNPGVWDTHYPGEFEDEQGNRVWVGGIGVNDFSGMSNKLELPVCVIGGCHNSQFNVTILATTDPDEEFMWTHDEPVGECFAWHLVRMSGGGTIASIGNTGLGYGAIGERGDIDGDGENQPDTLESVGGYQIRVFYKSIDEGNDILGDAWGGAIRKYLDTWPGMEDQTDCKHAQQWPILGDPSLKMGGYQVDGRPKTINLGKNLILNRIIELPIFQKLLNLI